ncbi:5-methyltetrahydrofolate--homocysteine methyltransferase [Ereboglobus sp. PH5-10]|uniref:cobalamin B12-binding domain-containing protein n=1 Tax=Ereboglobus sp. PH5-10 TaxID=2940629 RepID=UPI002406D5E5|nr:corrinoid protein [Ereboglobus sp. PH5-10]MDF9827232.1 5-methyltetrahydrofolate--homocysteine methyltransferase [Ereboglobus sp. PH5-10]
MSNPILEQLSAAVIGGKSKDAKAATQHALDANIPLQEIVDNALVSAMGIVGEKFKRNEIFVPEMLIAARAMKESMGMLEPLLAKAGIVPKYTAVIGTVQGDLHDIGKNLVAMMWKGANFRVVDLGVNVTPEKFLAAAKEHNADVVGLSALLTTTMPAMKSTVALIKEANLPKTKVMIGGAPITQQFADEIGADGYSSDAGSAVDKACELIGATA